MKQKLLLKTLLLLCALVAGSSSVWADENILTLDCATPAPTGSTSTALSGASDIATFLNSAAGLSEAANKITCSAKTGDVYKGKGSGGGDIPQQCLKVGKASGGGGFTFTIPNTYDDVDLVEITCYGWKTTSSISINDETAQTFTTAQTEVTKTFELASATKTFEIAVTTSAVCITEIVLKKKVAASVANPTFSPAAGAVEKGTSVTISTTTDGASIYYTTDGSTPTSSNTKYSSALTINSAQTIKAIAIKGSDASSVITAAYTIKKVASPTFTVDEGQVIEGTTVELATTTEGATIHYTTDGTTPTSSSTTYTSAISIDANMTIKAIAVKSNWDDSDIASASYTVLTPIHGLSIDFEANDVSRYVDWEFNNIVATTSTITAHRGTYYGNTDGKATARITTKAKVANPGKFTCFISKESKNTTDSNWNIQVSDDGLEWTDVATKSATGMSKGVWQEFSADLTAYTNVYVRLCYGSNTAVRAVDDIVLTDGEYPVAIPASGFATLFCAGPLDFSGTSVKAYVVKDNDASDGYVTLTQVSKVPAETGLVLEGSAGTVNIPLFDGTGAADVTGNKMAGSATTTTTVAANAGYILKDGAFHPSSGANALPAGKAYLNIAVPTNNAPALKLDFGGATGINTVQSSEFMVNGEFYNLAGQRVAQPTKGLYIVNGKKVIIK